MTIPVIRVDPALDSLDSFYIPRNDMGAAHESYIAKDYRAGAVAVQILCRRVEGRENDCNTQGHGRRSDRCVRSGLKRRQKHVQMTEKMVKQTSYTPLCSPQMLSFLPRSFTHTLWVQHFSEHFTFCVRPLFSSMLSTIYTIHPKGQLSDLGNEIRKLSSQIGVSKVETLHSTVYRFLPGIPAHIPYSRQKKKNPQFHVGVYIIDVVGW